MLKGLFEGNIPLVQLIVAWGHSVQMPAFILDTGFTGDLQVTPKIAKDLGLNPVGVEKIKIANGSIVDMPVALALVSMEGSLNSVNVLISDSLPLAGIGLLTKFSYKAIVDCKNRVVIK